MEQNSQNLRKNQDTNPAQLEGTVLLEWYRPDNAEPSDSCGAETQEIKVLSRVLEYPPEDQQTVRSAEEFVAHRKRFLAAAKKLSEQKIPHLPELTSCVEMNEAVHCVFSHQSCERLSDSDFPRTAAYIRSLGIALCDTYIAAHRAGLLCGRLTSADIQLAKDGTFYLLPENILLTTADGTSDRTADMHILTSFLSGMMASLDSEDDSTDAAILKNVLQYGYQDAELLKKALICEDAALKKPQTLRSSRKPAIRAVLCVLFLLISAAGIFWFGREGLPLSLCLKLGLIRNDVISVWMPMDAALDETETQQMYSKLTAGFERKYPGYGVNLVIFADDSFTEALETNADRGELPVVFMNTEEEIVQGMAADLHLLTQSLDSTYLTDMTSFETMIPLGCSLPMLYYHVSDKDEQDAETIAFSEIDSEIGFDRSASAFADAFTDGNVTENSFSDFLESRSEIPVLASSTCIAAAEDSALHSGAVRMLPVSVNGTYPVQYEMYCTINESKDWNSKHIGMLWLQYLLTEEAQQIMFAEYYSALPMHSNVLPQTIGNHEALRMIEDIQPGFDTHILQQGGAK